MLLMLKRTNNSNKIELNQLMRSSILLRSFTIISKDHEPKKKHEGMQ